jgi:hypothetical protein
MTTDTTGATFVQAATLLATHLANHPLPPPTSLTVTTRAHHSEVVVQVPSTTVAVVAADLLAWADTLTTATVTVWRPPQGQRVHLSITSTLTSPTGTVDLEVYGGADHDPILFTDLAPNEHRTVCLDSLRAWVATAAEATSSAVLKGHAGP